MDDLDPETAERLLRGEQTGPPELDELLAAASAAPTAAELAGEDAAVAAFRRWRTARRRPFGVKTAVLALLLGLGGGVAATATAQHLPLPHSGGAHPHRARTDVRPTVTHHTPRRRPLTSREAHPGKTGQHRSRDHQGHGRGSGSKEPGPRARRHPEGRLRAATATDSPRAGGNVQSQ